MTSTFKKATIQAVLKRDNSKPVFPCVVLTPDNRLAVYFDERTAFIAPDESKKQTVDGVHAGLFVGTCTHIDECRPVAAGTHITFIN